MDKLRSRFPAAQIPAHADAVADTTSSTYRGVRNPPSAPPSNLPVTANSAIAGELTSTVSASAPLSLKLEAARAADVTIVADGKTSFAGHMSAGDVKQFTALDSIQVTSNEASAVLIDLNGQMVVLPGQAAQPGSITLTQKDLKPASGASH